MLFFATKSLRHMKLIISMKPQEIKKKRIEKTNFLIVHKHFFFGQLHKTIRRIMEKNTWDFFFNRCDRCAPLRPPPPVPGVDPASLPKVTPDRADWGQRSCHGD